MASVFRDIWSWNGKVGRGTYALFGVCGLAIKHNLDRIIANAYGFRWGVWNYLDPLQHAAHFSPLSINEKKFLVFLILTALPFVWIGIALTLKRLRDSGQPLWLTLLFFVPVVNVLFFVVLSTLPSAVDQANPSRMSADGERGNNYWPKSRLGSAAVAAIIAGSLGTLMTWFDLKYLGSYGLTLFIAVPFVMGYLAVWVHSRSHELTYKDVMVVVTFSVLLAGAGITAIAVEGIVCLAMAAPLAWLLAIAGGSLANLIHTRTSWPHSAPSTFGALIIVLPMLLGVEHSSTLRVPRFQVRTSIEIAAPPEIVWNHIIRFPPIATPQEWPFQLGIAYPIEATLIGEGLSADRECRFSTGRFKEPILVWDPGKHFAFAVSEEPLLMKETSPYNHIHVRHLEDHDFQPERADFVITALSNGGTRLEGTTTYANKMWPGVYWRLWTDSIIHSIHNRVFNHVKALAESDVRGYRAALTE
jgi:uncharacterized membrane protein YhaH (DUF805 family)